MGEPLLAVAGLSKTYRRRRGEPVRALDDVDLTARRGEIVGLLGPNGAGKSTTIRCICGLVAPTSGTITIGGFDTRARRSRAAAHVAAVLEGNRTVHWRLSARENLAYFASLRGLHRRHLRARIEELIVRFDLADRADLPAMKLSRGMQQKLALACAVLVDVPLLLLDEPTLGLDVETSRQLRSYLQDLAREEGRAIMLSSHDMQVVRDVADRVVIINHGRVVVDAAVEELMALFRARSFRVTLEVPLAAAASEALARRFADVRIADGTITVVLRAAREIYELVDAFRAAGAVIESIDRVEPDLEDVFLRIVSGGIPAGEVPAP